MTIEKPRPKNKIMASTFYALLAEFGTSLIPLEELCKKYFNLGIEAAKKKARTQSLPVPVLKMKDSNDGRNQRKN